MWAGDWIQDLPGPVREDRFTNLAKAELDAKESSKQGESMLETGM